MRIAHMGFQPTIPPTDLCACASDGWENHLMVSARCPNLQKQTPHKKKTQINTSIWNRWDRFWICAEIDERERTHLVPDMHFHAPSPRRCPHGIPARQWNRSTKAGTDQKSRQKKHKDEEFWARRGGGNHSPSWGRYRLPPDPTEHASVWGVREVGYESPFDANADRRERD